MKLVLFTEKKAQQSEKSGEKMTDAELMDDSQSVAVNQIEMADDEGEPSSKVVAALDGENGD